MARKTPRKNNISELTNKAGGLSKKSERDKAIEALEKAKEVNKNRPIIYHTSRDNEFRRSLQEEANNHKKYSEIDELKKKIDKYNKRKTTILGRAYESGKSRKECCDLASLSYQNFARSYTTYKKDKDEYINIIKRYEEINN